MFCVKCSKKPRVCKNTIAKKCGHEAYVEGINYCPKCISGAQMCADCGQEKKGLFLPESCYDCMNTIKVRDKAVAKKCGHKCPYMGQQLCGKCARSGNACIWCGKGVIPGL